MRGGKLWEGKYRGKLTGQGLSEKVQLIADFLPSSATNLPQERRFKAVLIPEVSAFSQGRKLGEGFLLHLLDLKCLQLKLILMLKWNILIPCNSRRIGVDSQNLHSHFFYFNLVLKRTPGCFVKLR